MKIGIFPPGAGGNIRYLRRRFRLSRRSLAMLLGVSPQTLRRIERAKTPFELDAPVCSRILQVFDVEAETLIREDLKQTGYDIRCSERSAPAVRFLDGAAH